MRAYNPVETLAQAVYSCVNIKVPESFVSDFDIHHFPQMWSSTALGFGGLGGQAMTTDYTTVLIHRETGRAYVYFGGRYAYNCIVTADGCFRKDLRDFRVNGIKSAIEFYGAEV